MVVNVGIEQSLSFVNGASVPYVVYPVYTGYTPLICFRFIKV